MNQFNKFIILLSVLSTAACKTTQPVKPMAEYNQYFEREVSHLYIPIHLEIKELEQNLNSQFDGLVYEDNTFDDGDNLKISAEKTEPISITPDIMAIKYAVPLNLKIQYQTPLGVVKADASIRLFFRTVFDIESDWNLITETQVENYEWSKKPAINLGGFRISAGFIGNTILNRSREIIGKSIDEQIASTLNLRKNIQETWEGFFEPMLVSEEYNTWLTVNPISMSLTRPQMNDKSISTTVVVKAKPHVKLGDKPDAKAIIDTLPAFEYSLESGDDFSFFIGAEITFAQADSIAKSQLLGERFESGKYAVTIEDMEMYGRGNQLIINTKLSGSYNGNIFLTGKPVFNPKRGSVNIDDLKFTLDTKNFLHKSASWILKSTLKKQINKNLNFLLDYNLAEMEKMLREQMKHYELSQGFFLEGELDELKIQNAWMAQEGFQLIIQISGQAGVKMEGNGE